VIDLTKFCGQDGPKYLFSQPFVHGNRTYATDARILICLPTPGLPDSLPPDGLKYPPADNMLTWVDQPCDLEWLPFPAEPQFYGTSDGWCECPTCGEVTIWKEEQGVFLDLPGSCGPAKIGRKYADLLATLPNLQYQITGPEQAIRLRFDGGHGALMPLMQERINASRLTAGPADSQDSPG
jgi:hypothetical protein